MRVWVNSEEAREIRKWAAEAGRLQLADRFYRAEVMDNFSDPPLLWRWRARHPVLLQCLHCEQWEAFSRHRDAKKRGWMWWPPERERPAPLARRQRVYAKALTDGEEVRLVFGGWIHSDCVTEWEKVAASRAGDG